MNIQWICAAAILLAACTAALHAPHDQPAAIPAHAAPAPALQPDEFDAPAATAVAEAQKASGGGGHEGHEGQESETLYVCPMHPEVTSTTPGKCPKCGMTLVKKEK
jgi:hypothetical protein